MAPSDAVALRFLSANHCKDTTKTQMMITSTYTICNAFFSFLWVVDRGVAAPPKCSADEDIHSRSQATGSLSLPQCLLASVLTRDKAEDDAHHKRLRRLVAAYCAKNGCELGRVNEDSMCERAASLHLQHMKRHPFKTQ